MIVIPAKVKCDQFGCEVEGDITLELSTSKEHGIPKLSETSLPTNWGYSGVYQDGEHYCPEHRESRTRR